MKKLLMIVMACYGLTASAQGVDQSKNFIYLNSDSIIYADRITLRPDLAGYPQLRADSRRIPTNQVKFFNNDEGFFANTRRQTYMQEPAFAERTITGRINLFQPIQYRPHRTYAYNRRYDNNNLYQQQRAGMYYNKGFGDLKKVSHRNLYQDMTDHPESIELLDGYQKSMKTSTLLYATAGVSIVAAMVIFVASSGSNRKSVNTPPAWWPGTPSGSSQNFGQSRRGTNFAASFGLLGAGLGLAVGGFSVQLSGARKLENAIDAYNR